MSDLPSLISARYGTGPPAAGAAGAVGALPTASPALATLLGHKSLRHFAANTPLPAGTLDVLLAAAQSAPTSSNLQTWSVVAVEDTERKAQLATLAGDQDFVRNAPLFLVFVADLHRLGEVAAGKQKPAGVSLEYTEMFLMASLDAAFAAQNAVVAAEALGLGSCYVGAARNHAHEISELLGLPPRTVVVFGLAVGVPDPAGPTISAPVKPRLPAAEVLHREKWDDGEQRKHFEAYDRALDTFNAGEKRADQPSWTERSTTRVATIEGMHGRHELRQILHSRGFELR